MIFETRCAGCDKPGSPICTTCRFALLGPPPRPQPHGVVAAVPFTGRARAVVLSLKYRNRRHAARHLAGLLVNRLVEGGLHHQVDVVTWVPTSRPRRQARGFDQGEVIARTVARQLGLPCRRLLERSGASPAQTGRGRADRLDGPRVAARPGLDGRRVLVIDDVVTTGATLHAGERALRRQGARSVVLAAVASTPARADVRAEALSGSTVAQLDRGRRARVTGGKEVAA
jgi:ComF family protein